MRFESVRDAIHMIPMSAFISFLHVRPLDLDDDFRAVTEHGPVDLCR